LEFIPEEDNIIELFTCLNDLLAPQDELIIDVTHSYRSIPIAVLPIAHYLNIVKGIEVKGIYYGKIDFKAKCAEGEPCRGNIVDLTDLLYVERWSLAVDQFLRYGKGDQLARILDEEVSSRFHNSDGPHNIGRLRSALAQLSKSLAVNQQTMIAKEADRLYKVLSEDLHIEASGWLRLLLPLVDSLAKDMAVLKEVGSSVPAQLKLARWYLQHHDPASAALVVTEAMITRALQVTYPQIKLDNENQRMKLSHEIATLDKKHPFKRIYNDLTQKIRNSIAHCGMRKENMKVINIPQALEKLITEVEVLLEQPVWDLNDGR
jgi:CRISPR-associated DxTHG motif protein